MSIAERLKTIQKCSEVQLAIEGRYTNLRIWTGKDEYGRPPFNKHNTVYMRLDRANHYSVPLSKVTAEYLEKPNKIIDDLLEFGFKSPISNLEKILSITEHMKDRQCIEW